MKLKLWLGEPSTEAIETDVYWGFMQKEITQSSFTRQQSGTSELWPLGFSAALSRLSKCLASSAEQPQCLITPEYIAGFLTAHLQDDVWSFCLHLTGALWDPLPHRLCNWWLGCCFAFCLLLFPFLLIPSFLLPLGPVFLSHCFKRVAYNYCDPECSWPCFPP